VTARHPGPLGTYLPTTEGRQVFVRPTLFGDGVQVAIVGKRGGIVEALGIGLEAVPAFIHAVDSHSERAWEVRQKRARRSVKEKERRYREALASNPWLRKGGSPHASEKYIVRPR
jgi:hypothetical protein